ncbi:MAG: 16S rRNA (uracil(1498)-N(3))-methyltransferase [gamma proteobacterium symbiont of Bathyaustriella thionipta]|nr:16S rRNA (uracil(1498)-N(3))-methyltransferase [gamma proteobacterium symbiont of Bathyaustriella thionipta]MCU7951472.1 16S rRNA (uracil(1498)-N(3))-methyltransferase [gamma proteobacterium symbiont of Bathyaustriella thionipta]MCU7953427.1 16S rRNA (uracil(1498)-N(3))-methyltransferase [gamma proteobacterium symbiont of Bathyaustriella thionipta]MCU7958047.1 16S rRNA (uracil(1498)-N(3))-methyltransferase [gamma proteobacterium symbiont of Bathyaustriella thionipta]MCU7968922.1 16S rRNA (ur
MRLSRFFIDEALSPGQSLILPAYLVNYMVNVLRLKTGAKIILFNGHPINKQHGEYTATLTEVSKRHGVALIETFNAKNLESPLKTQLFQGISRSERMDYTIQKAVELGIASITPVFTQRSNSRKLNDKQLQKKYNTGRVSQPVLVNNLGAPH